MRYLVADIAKNNPVDYNYYSSDSKVRATWINEETGACAIAGFRKEGLKVGDQILFYGTMPANLIFDDWAAYDEDATQWRNSQIHGTSKFLQPEEIMLCYVDVDQAMVDSGSGYVWITYCPMPVPENAIITAIEIQTNTSNQEDNNQGGEELMEREIMLGLGSIKVKKLGIETAEYTTIGDTKSEAKLVIEEKYADVKTVESGTVKKVLESTTVTLEATVSQLSKELLAKLTNMENSNGALSGGGGIGTVADEFELIFHPLDEGAGTDWDVMFLRCTLETKLEKNAKPGEQAGLNIKAEALYDREAGKKFQIGA